MTKLDKHAFVLRSVYAFWRDGHVDTRNAIRIAVQSCLKIQAA